MQRLSDRERKLLSAIELRGSSSHAEIGKLCSLKPHTVAYTIKRLQDRQIISESRPIIDLTRLGFIHYTFFIALRYEKEDRNLRLLKKLQQLPECTWLYEVGGEYDYGFSLTIRNAAELSRIIEEINEENGECIFNKQMCLQRFFAYFGHRHFAPKLKPANPLLFYIDEEHLPIDKTDHKILHALTLGPSRIGEAAKSIEVPLATFERRKCSLEKNGIIRGYLHRIDASAIGFQSYILQVKLRGFSETYINDFLEIASQEPRVLFVNECLGAWDFEVGVTLKSGTEVQEISKVINKRLGDKIQSLSVVPVFRYLKYKTYWKELIL